MTQAESSVSRWWWLPLLQGLAALALALVLLWQPLQTLLVLTFWVGAFWFADGVLNLIRAWRGGAGAGRTWLLLAGVIGIVAGAVVVFHPVLAGVVSLAFIAALLAVSMLVNGVVLMLAGRAAGLGAQRQRSWGSFGLGALYVLGGAALLLNPGVAVSTLLYLFVFWALLVGALLIALAFALKRGAVAA